MNTVIKCISKKRYIKKMNLTHVRKLLLIPENEPVSNVAKVAEKPTESKAVTTTETAMERLLSGHGDLPEDLR